MTSHFDVPISFPDVPLCPICRKGVREGGVHSEAKLLLTDDTEAVILLDYHDGCVVGWKEHDFRIDALSRAKWFYGMDALINTHPERAGLAAQAKLN